MLRSIRGTFGYRLHAMDGQIGDINDFSFDDQSWTVRYLVLDIGAWTQSRRVLLPTEALETPNPGWESGIFLLQATMNEVRNSLSIDDDPTVSHQKKIEEVRSLAAWEKFDIAFIERFGLFRARPEARVSKHAGPIHLRSAREVLAYRIQAKDGEIGQANDLLVDEDDWSIRYLVVDIGNWLRGRTVLIAPARAERVDWSEGKVFLDVLRESVRNSPEYHGLGHLNRT